MTLMYGPSFTSAYGDAPNVVWEAAISKLTDEQCRKGLSSLAKQPREYPANLTQFVAACTERAVRFLGGPSAMYDPKLLDVQRANLEHVRARVEHMKRVLGASQGSPPEPTIAQKACTCQGLGECEVCQEWSKRMLEFNGGAQ